MNKDSADTTELIRKARAYWEAGDHRRAKFFATEAIKTNPALTDARIMLALACRYLREYSQGIEEYTQVIDIDPQNAQAWMWRGACRFEASTTTNGPGAAQLLDAAHADYKRAAEIRPDDEEIGLSLLEFEVCTDKHLEAIGTSGELWNHIQNPHFKLVCAWLAALALILRGRPEFRWARYKDFLTTDETRLSWTYWSVVETDSYLKRLESRGAAPAQLEAAKEIHRLFLNHFVHQSLT